VSAPLAGIGLGDGRRLRLLDEDDADELYGVVAANRAHLSPWMPWAPTQTLERTLEFIRASRRQIAQSQGFQAAILRDEAIVGVIGFHRIDWPNRLTTVGYWLAEGAQGQGTMTAAARALIEHAFGQWGLNRVEIHAGVGNIRSRAVAERLGFTEEGVVREAELVGTHFVDHVLYGLLAREWPTVSSDE